MAWREAHRAGEVAVRYEVDAPVKVKAPVTAHAGGGGGAAEHVPHVAGQLAAWPYWLL